MNNPGYCVELDWTTAKADADVQAAGRQKVDRSQRLS
jgi:hypothetical protein